MIIPNPMYPIIFNNVSNEIVNKTMRGSKCNILIFLETTVLKI